MPVEEQQVVLFDQVTSGSKTRAKWIKKQSWLVFKPPWLSFSFSVLSRLNRLTSTQLFHPHPACKRKEKKPIAMSSYSQSVSFLCVLSDFFPRFMSSSDRDVLVVAHDCCVCVGFSCGTVMSV